MDLLRPFLMRIVLIVVLTSIHTVSGFTRLQDRHNHAEELTQGLAALSSADWSERRAAQATLLGLGRKAIPPLLGLLKSLTPGVEVCPPGSNLPCTTTSLLLESDSRRTIRGDVIALIGQLHAESAVSLLIKIMGLEGSVMGDGFRYSGPETRALVEIGEPAVRELLDSLSLAAERRLRMNSVDGIRPPYLQIEVRIIAVLGDIGDRRALPLFEQLKVSAQPFLASCLEEAMVKISQKQPKQ